jgi:adenylate cyclase
VLVGALDAVGIHDNYPTPGSGDEKMYGVEVHANIIETIYNGLPERQDAIGQTLPLHPQSRSTQMILIFLMGLGAGIVLPFMRWYIGLLAVTGIYALYWLVASYAFVERGEIYELLFPAGSLAFTYTAAAVISYVFEERRRGQIHDLFSRYVSPEIAQKIVESYDQGKLQLGGEERELTVLFADIRGFTPLSEGLAPAEVVALLNVFLEEMSTIVMKNGGAINKYIGDNIMAFWNAPYPQPDHAWMAVQAGLGMLEAVRRLNASGRFVTPVQFGIGINTGLVVVGNVGSRQRLEYTPIGDTVNTASRLCGVAPGGACFVGKGTYEIVKDRITPVQVHRMMLKGKHEPVEIYELRPDPEKKA